MAERCGITERLRVAGRAVAWLAITALPAGCTTDVPGPNRAPLAHAGADREVRTGSDVTLDASLSMDPDGDRIVSWFWQLAATPDGRPRPIPGDDQEVTTFAPDVPGIWLVRLRVGDGHQLSAPDAVRILARGIPCASDADCPDDGQWCTGRYSCVDGVCELDMPVCDDGDVCTQDVCNEDLDRCDHPPVAEPPAQEGPVDDPSCTDGRDNDCDGLTDTDDPGCIVCGQDADCDDANTCTRDLCEEQRCENTPVSDGTACYDALFCTVDDTCRHGICIGEQRDCSQVEDACNRSACDEQRDSCVPVPQTGASCDDQDACTMDDACDSEGVCNGIDRTIVPVEEGGCDDGNPCTYNGCDPGSGACSWINNTETCDDGHGCTFDDRCAGGICAGTPDDAACPDGQLCRPACFPGVSGCGAPPQQMQLDCTPDPVDVFAGGTAHCVLDAGQPGQAACIQCRAELGTRVLERTGFDGCDLGAWNLVIGESCSDQVNNCTPGGTRACCDQLDTICITRDGNDILRSDRAQNCGGGVEEWRLSSTFDFRDLWQPEICLRVAEVDADGNCGALVYVRDAGHGPTQVVCRNGDLRPGTDGVFVRLCGRLPDWTDDNPSIEIVIIAHSESDGREVLLDGVEVHGWASGCTPSRAEALEEDFDQCPDPLPDGWEGWAVSGAAACNTDTWCYEGSTRIEVAGDTATLERVVDASGLDGDVLLCFHHGDDGGDPAKQLLVEFDAGSGWRTAWVLDGDPGQDGTCAESCVDLTALDQAAARNPALGIRFTLTSAADPVVLDHVVLSGSSWCDATGSLDAAPLQDEGGGSYRFDVGNPGAASALAEVVCRWEAPAPLGVAAAAPVDFLDPLPAWRLRRRLVFDNSDQDVDLRDMQVLVRLDQAWFDHQALQAGQSELRFVDEDLRTLLAHEVESWDRYESSAVWVRVPRIPARSQDDSIWMYYGNPDAADHARPAAVWDKAFLGVWHLAEETGTTAHDASGHLHDGSYQGDPPLGQQGGFGDLAVSFDGENDYVGLGNLDIFPVAEEEGITIEVFAESDAAGADRVLVAKSDGDGVDDHWWSLSLQENGTRLHFRLKLDGTTLQLPAESSDMSGRTWFYAAATYDGSAMRLYVDGQPDGSLPAQGAVDTDPGKEVRIGAGLPDISGPWRGRIGEVRLSALARPAAWIRARFLSMNGTFLDVGNQQSRQ